MVNQIPAGRRRELNPFGSLVERAGAEGRSA